MKNYFMKYGILTLGFILFVIGLLMAIIHIVGYEELTGFILIAGIVIMSCDLSIRVENLFS